MRFLVLGQPVVVSDGRRLSVGPPEQRALLVALVLNANRPVPASRLIDGIWQDRRKSALTELRTTVNGLHEALGSLDREVADRLTRAVGGYLLSIEPDEADSLQFLGLLGQGRDALVANNFQVAVDLLTEAMSLWRGPIGSGVAVFGWLRAQLAELEDLRPRAVERVAEAWRGLERPGDGDYRSRASRRGARGGRGSPLGTGAGQ